MGKTIKAPTKKTEAPPMPVYSTPTDNKIEKLQADVEVLQHTCSRIGDQIRELRQVIGGLCAAGPPQWMK